jgi:hypothetical protein
MELLIPFAIFGAFIWLVGKIYYMYKQNKKSLLNLVPKWFKDWKYWKDDLWKDNEDSQEDKN